MSPRFFMEGSIDMDVRFGTFGLYNIDTEYLKYLRTIALKIFAALDLKKMIPVPGGQYNSIDFSSLEDKKYADLLIKEYRFCKKIQSGILSKVTQIYREQKETGKVFPLYCNFTKLESACTQYSPN